jgi:preprotein translocase subunit SecD
MLHQSKWKIWIVILICIVGLIYAAPNLLTQKQLEQFPSWLQKQVKLGLDLRGGSQLLLEVDVRSGMQDRLNSIVDVVRRDLRKQQIGYVGLGVKRDAISFKFRDPSDEAKVKKLLKKVEEGLDLHCDSKTSVITLSYSEEAISQRSSMLVQQSIEIVRRRIDEAGTKEPNIQRQGRDCILVQLPGVSDPAHIKALLGKTAKMTFHLVRNESMGSRPESGTLTLSLEGHRDRDKATNLVIEQRSLLGGENLVDAQPGIGQYNTPMISFRFDTVGARKFAEITRNNIGRRFSIVLDGRIIVAPVIRSVIPNGQGIIEGDFTVQEARDLALLMRAGAIILVAVFMIIAYSMFGLVANFALIFNIILLVAVMSMLQATLTLPGIAGIALTVGMAVDANVLIYERIKEELHLGHKIAGAINAGYRRAMSTIIDSNLTTLIGALLLFQFGSGSIRGFAVTMSLGIIISMFTAIALTRVIITWWFNWYRPSLLPI